MLLAGFRAEFQEANRNWQQQGVCVQSIEGSPFLDFCFFLFCFSIFYWVARAWIQNVFLGSCFSEDLSKLTSVLLLILIKPTGDVSSPPVLLLPLDTQTHPAISLFLIEIKRERAPQQLARCAQTKSPLKSQVPLPSSSLYSLPGFLLFSAHVSRAKCWGTDVLISDTLRTGHYEAPSIDREAQKGWWLSQGHIAAQEQTRRSGIQTLNSWQLVPGSPQSENCWIWGWLWLYKRSQKWGQPPLHVRRD